MLPRQAGTKNRRCFQPNKELGLGVMLSRQFPAIWPAMAAGSILDEATASVREAFLSEAIRFLLVMVAGALSHCALQLLPSR